MPFAVISTMDPEILILREVRQTQIYDITCIWNLKNETNELTDKTEINSQTQKTNLWLPKRGRLGGVEGGLNKLRVWNQQIQTTIHKTHNKVLTVQQREQYSRAKKKFNVVSKMYK